MLKLVGLDLNANWKDGALVQRQLFPWLTRKRKGKMERGLSHFCFGSKALGRLSKHIVAVMVVAIIIGLASVVLCQQKVSAPTSKITGTLVEKASGKPIAGVGLIVLEYAGTDSDGKAKLQIFIVKGFFPKAVSDAKGRFSFADLPAGQYVIKCGPDQYNLIGDYIRAKGGAQGDVMVIDLPAGTAIDLGTVYVGKE